MPGAVLRVGGERFDPDAALTASSLRPYLVRRKGEHPFLSRPEVVADHGSFCCDVSSADGDLAAHAREAIEFLTRHRDDLARLRDDPAVDYREIDFGYVLRIDGHRVVVQCDTLPHDLLRLAGELRIDFVLSLYPRCDENA